VDIGKWDAGTWIAALGAVIALVAAAAAVWQARLARRAAGTADVQAAAAQAQAEAAQAQAAAAEEQVIIMRQQVADSNADRHKAAAPGFTFPRSTFSDAAKGQPSVAHISVRQVGGQKLSGVTVTVDCDDHVLGFIEDGGGTVSTIHWTTSAPGSTCDLKVSLAKAESVDVILSFTCVGAETSDTWITSGTTRPILSRPIAFGVQPRTRRR
jgi:hypothetical protein